MIWTTTNATDNHRWTETVPAKSNEWLPANSVLPERFSSTSTPAEVEAVGEALRSTSTGDPAEIEQE
jgi:hypothetical protein